MHTYIYTHTYAHIHTTPAPKTRIQRLKWQEAQRIQKRQKQLQIEAPEEQARITEEFESTLHESNLMQLAQVECGYSLSVCVCIICVLYVLCVYNVSIVCTVCVWYIFRMFVHCICAWYPPPTHPPHPSPPVLLQ